MTDRKFPWQNILKVTYDRLLTGFDDGGIVIGLADDDQGDTPVPVLRCNSDDTAALLGDLLAFVASGSEGYAGGQTRAYGLTRDGDDLVVLTPINAETVVAVRIPVDAVPTVIAALQQAQDGRDDLTRFDETMRNAHPDDFDKP
jgi:hypothetical protein